jgi:glycosyltransferase involved in cell wall biosynthesis
MKRPILSVLVCSIPGRFGLLKLLLDELSRQSQSHSSKVEILALTDDKSMPVGEKRNRMVRAANGEYVVFIDDDDWIADHYLDSILKALECRPDVVTIVASVSLDNGPWHPCYYSLLHPFQVNEESHYERWPNHLCPMRRDLVLEVGYPTIRFGEDTAFATNIRPLLHKQVQASTKPLYFYRFSSKKDI